MKTGRRVRQAVVAAGGTLTVVGVAVGLWELGCFWRASSPTMPSVPVWQVSQPWELRFEDLRSWRDMGLASGVTAVDPCWRSVWPGAQVDPPTPTEQPTAKVPKGCAGGTVILDLVVDSTGAVREPRLLRNVEGCGDTAMALVSRWRYHPARWRGAPVDAGSCQVSPGDPLDVHVTVALLFDAVQGDVEVETPRQKHPRR